MRGTEVSEFATKPMVYVVDDDAGALRSLCWLIEQAGLPVRAFHSGRAFLDEYHEDEPGCLVLDVRMAHTSGPALQDELNDLGARIPIVFMRPWRYRRDR